MASVPMLDQGKGFSGSMVIGPSVFLATSIDNPSTNPNPTADQPTAPSPPASGGASKLGWSWTIVAAVVMAVIIVVAGYAILERGHGTSSSTTSQVTVLLPAGTLYSLPVDNYNAVLLTVSSPVNVSATITNIGGAQVYLMTVTQYHTLFYTYNATLAGYEWTTGPIPSGSYYNLKISIPVGEWDIAFTGDVPGNVTAIGFYTALIETS